ncbi:MAG: SPOR domain-containing protein, partial [Burkholderiaceae bacterium]
MKRQHRPPLRRQLGGTLMGFVVGVLVGLASALAVAVYVTKVPIPFVDRGVSRNPGEDLLEAERNRNWNPNAGLGGGAPAPAVPPAGAPSQEGAIVVQPEASTKAPAASGDPLGDLLRSRMGDAAGNAPAPAEPATDGVSFYVQVGAFRNVDDAEAQRARLAMLGIEASVSERLQSGQTFYRVRVGPFAQKAAADLTKEQIATHGIDAALVR